MKIKNAKNAPFTRTAQQTQPKLLGKEDGKIISSPGYSSNIEPMSQTTQTLKFAMQHQRSTTPKRD